MLVGGSSRIPLVSEMLSAEFGRPLAIDNHPKHDVALGAAIRGTPAARPAAARPAPTPAQTGRRSRRQRRVRRDRPSDRPADRSHDRPATVPATEPVGPPTAGTAYLTPAAADDTGAAPAVPPGPAPDWRPPTTVGPMTSPAGATGLTARLPAAVQGKRGRMLIGTGAVVVALAVGTGILLGTRKAEPDPSLTGVQSSIPTSAPAPLPVPVPVVVPETITVGDADSDRDRAHADREGGHQADAGHDDDATPDHGPSSPAHPLHSRSHPVEATGVEATRRTKPPDLDSRSHRRRATRRVDSGMNP